MKMQRIRQAFLVSVLLKGAHAVMECVGGLALALVSTDAITSWIKMFTQEELIEDPQDLLANYLITQAQGFSVSTKNFYAFYLLSHGIVKLLLVIGLLRNKLWSYPASLVVFSLFILYQLYRFSYTQGIGLIVLTLFDVLVMWLIWREYEIVRRHLPKVVK